MPEIRLWQQLIGTDRGDLWLAEKAGVGRCLVRLLDRRFADTAFRSSLEDLRMEMARHPAPRVLPITDHDFCGDHYYVEYRLDWARTKSVPEYFAQVPWLKRLRFVQEILTIYDDWRQRVAPPVGLHGGRVVACYLNSHWMAHLAPCPPISLASPYDLAQANPDVLSALAPERLRRASVLGVMEDVYAVAVLALQALGVRTVAENCDKEVLIEVQARALLPSWDLGHSAIEKTLWHISLAKGCLLELSQMVRRCTAFSPDARPGGLQEFHHVLDLVLAFEDAAKFAKVLDNQLRPEEALLFLEWALACQPVAFGEEHHMRLLAADLCSRLGKPAQELNHLERLLRIISGRHDLEHRRMEIRYDSYLKKASQITNGADPEADWLLAELERFRSSNPGQLDMEDRQEMKEDRLRAAMIYGRRGDLHRRAQELWAITELEWADIDSLFLYGLSLRDLQDDARMTQQYHGELSATMNALLHEADRRLDKLKAAEMLDDNEVTKWTERFQSLQLHS